MAYRARGEHDAEGKSYLAEEIAEDIRSYLTRGVGESYVVDNTHLPRGREEPYLLADVGKAMTYTSRRKATFHIGIATNERGYRATVEQCGECGCHSVTVFNNREPRNGGQASA